MESYNREFSWYLSISEGNKKLDPHIDYKRIVNNIKLEILDACSPEDKAKMGELFQKIDNSILIFNLGCENDLLCRGAIELQRLLPALASFHFGDNLVGLLDELSQLFIKGEVIESEAEEYNLSEVDVSILESLGAYGFEADRYNEEVLSCSFYTIIEPDTQIGNFSADEVSNWLCT